MTRNDGQPNRGDAVEQALADAGAQWRAAQPPPPEPDVARIGGRAATGRWWQSGAARRWAPLAAIAGVAAALVIVAVPLGLYRSGGGNEVGAVNGSTGATPPAGVPVPWPASAGAAVPVQGTGTLFRNGTEPIRLCSQVVATMDLPTSSAGCGAVSVLTTGVDESLLVNTTTGGQAYSGPVRVEGTYGGGTLAVTRVVPAVPDPVENWVEPPLPCPPPPAGWEPEDPAAWEAQNRLIETVRSNPETYTDVWEAHPSGVPSGPKAIKVLVVGAKGDVAAARSRLAALYSGNLCVHPVTHSAADLARITEKLKSVSSTPIEAYPAVTAPNKVEVKVVALDPPTVAILDAVGRDALIVAEPLLQWLD
jgi:hypothetical protein